MHRFVQVNRQKTTVKKKITYFLKKLCCFFIHMFLKNSLQLSSFLPLGVFEVFCVLYLKFNPHYLYLLLRMEKCVDLVVIFNKGINFCGIFTNRESCVYIKYLTLARSRKLIAVNFTFFIPDVKCT